MSLLTPANLLGPALEAGIKVPRDPTDFKRTRYPHFHVLCVLQLRYVRSLSHVEHNARVVSGVARNFIKILKPEDYRRIGVKGV